MLKNSKGVGLIIVLASILLMVAFASVGISFTLSNYYLVHHIVDGTRGFYLADAGVKRAIYKVKSGNFTSETWNFGGVDIAITINPDGSNYDIISVSTLGSLNTTKTIKATVDSTGKLLEWQPE